MGRPFRQPRDRNAALMRVFRLIRALQMRAWTLDELAQRLECSSRTVRRDIELLEELHAPIVHEEGARVRLTGPLPYVDDATRKETAA